MDLITEFIRLDGRGVAENKNTPVDTLKLLAKDDEEYVSNAAKDKLSIG